MSVRRLELVAADNILIFDATSAHQWTSCCAEAGPVASLFSSADFQHVEYLPASSVRRNRAQPTRLVGELTRRRPLFSQTVRAESIQGDL